MAIPLTIIFFILNWHCKPQNPSKMRKADLVNQISEKTGIPKVDVLVTLETMFKEVKDTLCGRRKYLYPWLRQFYHQKKSGKNRT